MDRQSQPTEHLPLFRLIIIYGRDSDQRASCVRLLFPTCQETSLDESRFCRIPFTHGCRSVEIEVTHDQRTSVRLIHSDHSYPLITTIIKGRKKRGKMVIY